MACHLNDNVYTQTFTPREYQVELLDAAKKRNTIVCSSTSTAKTFIAVKLLQEQAWEMRSPNGKRALFILDLQNVAIMASHIKLLTDLQVVCVSSSVSPEQWAQRFIDNSVVVIIAEICVELLTAGQLDFERINLLVIDDCLYGERQYLLEQLMAKYKRTKNEKPKILGLAAGLLGPELQPMRLEAELQRLEKLLCSSVDTSSELVTLLRLCIRPQEKLLECAQMVPLNLSETIEKIILNAKDFLSDHRYAPSEIYPEEFLQEIRHLPDPQQHPLQLLTDLLDVLYNVGAWGADQSALNLIAFVEKLKVKIPYERHFLLLCMVSSVLISIRATCDHAFKDIAEQDRIRQFSTPKVIRLLEVIKQFKPSSVSERPTEILEKSEKEVHFDPFSPKVAKNRGVRTPRRPYNTRQQTDDNLCALVFVQTRWTAKVLFSLLLTMSQYDDDYWWLSPLYSVDKMADPDIEPREAETEHRRQEEVLRKYRTHDCNIMIATSVLEHGCDLPKCNLVVRFDLPKSFHSYVQSKARARASDAYYLLLMNGHELRPFVKQLAEYMEVERTLLRRCQSLEPDSKEELEADLYTHCFPPFQPNSEAGSPNVTLSTAIALVNRYCAKLPSDTFTRLTPLWTIVKQADGYSCSIRLPINSPVKQKIIGPSVTNQLLARRATAYLTCKLLHLVGELDDQLQPIGKENFKASEEDWNNFPLEPEDEEQAPESLEPRPGTTKRRQYYYKRIADSLTQCRPMAGQTTYFYKIVMKLTCPLPEEQNTRGRKIYPPEESPQGFGILTSKEIPAICPFPIFTRSGEVSVSLELCSSEIVLTEDQIDKISEYLNFTFTNVLRLQRYLMLFDPQASENSYLIVPSYDFPNGTTDVDWGFIDVIYRDRDVLPQIIPEGDRLNYTFDLERYKDAVVMPWYRNQDQPQYFYVAEICHKLNPKSNFPGSEYATFEEYYLRKYGIQIQNSQQHLLDVDHTSARLNFLTPRYVNRKGVALPTSSEETKKAKRENLEQKQILIPELCAIHPFPASLWRKAVCLPCILYRINALLLADQIRKIVAIEMGLGKINIPRGFNWQPLNFGWNLSDVLKKSKEQEAPKPEENPVETVSAVDVTEEKDSTDNESEVAFSEAPTESEDESKGWMEIGTWSNEMAGSVACESDPTIRYASPTSWVQNAYDDFSDSDESFSVEESESDCGGLRIEFTGDNIAEAVEDEPDQDESYHMYAPNDAWQNDDTNERTEKLKLKFHEACLKNESHLLSSGVLVPKDQPFEKVNTNSVDLVMEKLTVPAELNIDLSSVTPYHANNLEVPTSVTFNTLDVINIIEPLTFSFDEQPNLIEHPGPSPSVILQALTMSNANDGINLERLETIGDSFLKYAITNYLYSKYENVHEGKLSHLRSKQVSNLNLYRLGKRKDLGDCMIATKFDPHDNWLPPCYYVPKELEEALMDARVPANYWTPADVAATRDMTLEEICRMVREHGEALEIPSIIPYNLVTQHSIPDKSIADCVEALIGAYLIECGPRGALLFMAWLGIRVLPQLADGTYGELLCPKTPLLRHVSNPEYELEILLDGYDEFENSISYRFRDRSYLIQALTHASYSPNALSDCYQRLEFLGDAVLDYLITRHLYEDKRIHSPGALTDLRSALVNNTIFASLAVRHGFHRYFRHLSPGLHEVVERFVRLQEESDHALLEDMYLLAEHECEEVEDVEVPKALGDVFESVAGAIFLDSGMSLDAVWKVYHRMMSHEIEQFSDRVPKSPIRELLELEPETAKFGKPEKLADGRRVRVTVEVFGKGVFKGIGRNYRIAKCTAAKCALRHLKRRGLIRKS